MLWGIASVAIAVIAIIVTVRAMQDQRQKGKNGFISFIVGCFVGGFFGAFLFVILGIVAIFAN
ncbi:hypothetical protein KZO85_12630 [Chromohalobacter canadensis]|uniref:hypothetical protein n=1 Tax=Chromohalobacter canadensis TaxID=141389 RepID=UPI0021C252C3|nr:hypothetical protein [Chromohalobacter canadensis]MCT8469431.1 hypothetical protein [Chromohalobacter canadensis]MCT8472055.1 hypothetical protein [Chromohalobacter canadensis]MCT8499832.1 hypothetical protein [Chromohalobacter canadensis]